MMRSPSATADFEPRPRLGRALARHRRHQGAPRPVAGGPRHPSGSARARMDEIDPLGVENARQPARIERHRQRIPGRGRKGKMQAAERLHLARQLARIGGDKSPRAGLNQRRRHGKRRPLVAAGGERGNDLQNRPPRERRLRPAPEGRKRADGHAPLRRGESLTRDRASAKSPPPDGSRAQRIAALAPGRVMRRAVSNEEPRYFTVGNPPDQRRIAFRRRWPARSGAPGLVWLCGYRSDMLSTKAAALDQEAERLGLGLLRFDYSGHGRSDGRLEDQTISRWLEETLAIVRAETEGPQIVLGSSMGGYLALLAARALNPSGEGGRIAGLILIAPAVDFTETLIFERAPEEARRAIMEEGAWRRPRSATRRTSSLARCIEDGQRLHARRHDPHATERGAAGHARRGRAIPARAPADAAPRQRPGDADPDQGRRPPPVRPEDLRLLFDALERMISP